MVKKSSVTVNVIVGILLTVVISILLAGCVATFVLKGNTNLGESIYIIMGMQYVSVTVGALAASKLSIKAPALVGGIVTVVYVFILATINILFVQGDMDGIWRSLLSSGLGWGTACAICTLKPHKTKYRKVRNR